MPSPEHEVLVDLSRDEPEFVSSDLLTKCLKMSLPEVAEARHQSADLSQLEPTEYRADSVVALFDAKGESIAAVVVEVQRSRDSDKRFAWPAYLATLRARVRCDTLLVVVACDKQTARWAGQPIPMGHPDWVLKPLVVDPSVVPVLNDAALAARHPRLAVLSALMHHAHERRDQVFSALVEGMNRLDRAEAQRYIGAVLIGLSDDTARKHLEELMKTKRHELYKGMARRFFDEGEVKAGADAILTVLTTRGLKVSSVIRQRIKSSTDPAQLSDMLKRAVTVQRAEDLFA